MQIHELNNYSGSLGDAYLAADNGSDTGKMKTTALTDPLNARIDNIIAGPAPSAAEIVDARLGADGVTYPSLGAAIRDQVTDLKSDLTNLGSNNYFPKRLENYPYNLQMNFSVLSDFYIENSYIKTVTINSATTESVTAYIYFIDENNICTYLKPFILKSGLNVVTINEKISTRVRIGTYGSMPYYKNDVSITPIETFSTGLRVVTPARPTVGSTITIENRYAQPFALDIQINTVTGVAEDVARFKATIEHPPILSFIDDDGGKYAPEIWGRIINDTNIRMGFAIVSGHMDGTVTPTETYEPMPLETVKQFYDNGHEIYSHSYSHPAFYESTYGEIDYECLRSRTWLHNNGFTRNADVIVYPGGLGEDKIEQQKVVSRHYRFGVDTVGFGGINEDNKINPYCIHRYNGDTAPLETLKAFLDECIVRNGHMVMMFHAYQMNENKEAQITKVIDFIAYARSKGVEILPFEEAMHEIYRWNKF